MYIHIHIHIYTYVHTYVPTYIRTSPNREHTIHTSPHIYIPTKVHTYIHKNVYPQRQKKREFALFFFRARRFRFFRAFFLRDTALFF